MAGNKMGEQTKEKILQAAQDVFLEQGFESARVEEIARQAGITKVMLYYHFETKQNLFNAVLRNLVDQIGEEFRKNFPRIRQDNPREFEENLSDMLAFYRQHTDVLRLVLSETIRSSQQGTQNLTIFGDMFNLILGHTADASPQPEQEQLIRIFFFNALPMLLFAPLSPQFCEGFGIDPQKCEQEFTRTFSRVFFENMNFSERN